MVLSIRRRRDRRRCLHVRVWLNHVDITNQCTYADGRRGVVRRYRTAKELALEPTTTRRRVIRRELVKDFYDVEYRGHVRIQLHGRE